MLVVQKLLRPTFPKFSAVWGSDWGDTYCCFFILKRDESWAIVLSLLSVESFMLHTCAWSNRWSTTWCGCALRRGMFSHGRASCRLRPLPSASVQGLFSESTAISPSTSTSAVADSPIQELEREKGDLAAKQQLERTRITFNVSHNTSLWCRLAGRPCRALQETCIVSKEQNKQGEKAWPKRKGRSRKAQSKSIHGKAECSPLLMDIQILERSEQLLASCSK